jgi:hypothetical protein
MKFTRRTAIHSSAPMARIYLLCFRMISAHMGMEYIRTEHGIMLSFGIDWFSRLHSDGVFHPSRSRALGYTYIWVGNILSVGFV